MGEKGKGEGLLTGCWDEPLTAKPGEEGLENSNEVRESSAAFTKDPSSTVTPCEEGEILRLL